MRSIGFRTGPTGAKLQCRVEMINRVFDSSQILQCQSDVVERFRIFGLNLNRPPIAAQGIDQPPDLLLRQTAIHPCMRHGRLMSNRFFERDQCFRVPSQYGESVAAIIMGDRKFRIEPNRGLIEPEAQFRAAPTRPWPSRCSRVMRSDSGSIPPRVITRNGVDKSPVRKKGITFGEQCVGVVGIVGHGFPSTVY